MRYFPAFLDLKGRRAVVVGGGRVAERKVRTLLRAGARITVVSPRLTLGLSELSRKGEIFHRARNFRKGDLRDALVVVAATDVEQVNTRVAEAAPALVNVADSPERSNFIVPSVCARGDLLLAVSTSGTSPALSAAIRRELENLYGPEFGVHLKRIGRAREKILSEENDPVRRRRLLKALGSDTALKDIRKSRRPGT